MGLTPIGLLGGSFDPIHHGHLQLARDALDRLLLQEVRFVPAAQPWQKGELAEAEHRARMVQIAIAREPRFVLDMHEIERGGVTYTIDTLRELRTQLPGQPLVLIIGSDQFARLDTWRDWRSILENAHVAIAQRAGTMRNPATPAHPLLRERAPQTALAAQLAGGIVDFEMKPVECSATEVRRLLRESPSAEREQRLSAMVPASVLDYIHLHHLYRK